METLVRHGIHKMADKSPEALELARVQALPLAEPEPGDTPFDYMFRAVVDDPANRLPEADPAAMVTALKALGAAMVENPPADEDNSTIPTVYTYWGQFIDHDLTLTKDLKRRSRRDHQPAAQAAGAPVRRRQHQERARSPVRARQRLPRRAAHHGRHQARGRQECDRQSDPRRGPAGPDRPRRAICRATPTRGRGSATPQRREPDRRAVPHCPPALSQRRGRMGARQREALRGRRPRSSTARSS